jgi:hypothetical protein
MSTDTDTAARQRIVEVTTAVMQKAADSLSVMANQIIHNIRTDEKFLGAILTPGVDLNLDLQVPDELEHKIMVLVADCVAKDRVETLETAIEKINDLCLDSDGSSAVERMLEEAKAEAADIKKAADEVRAATPPAVEQAEESPGIVLPQGLVRCKCGRAATPLTKCAHCGQDVGIKL